MIYKPYPEKGEVSDSKNPEFESLYGRIKLLSNKKKFEIIKSTQDEPKNITELSKELRLAYNKCSDYVAELAKEKLVMKVKEGKEVYVKSNIVLSEDDLKPKKDRRNQELPGNKKDVRY